MSEPAQKCENYAILKQNYTLDLFIALKRPNHAVLVQVKSYIC